jgi:hypothetical protein
VTLRGLSDYKGDELIERFMRIVDERKPLHERLTYGRSCTGNRRTSATSQSRAEAGNVRRRARGLRASAGISRGMYVRPDDRVSLGGSGATHHAVPIRW